MEKLIVANLKMNLTKKEILNYKKILEDEKRNIIICPSNIYLDLMKSDKYFLGAQNSFYEEKGAYTGEVSFAQLKSIETDYCLIGHSERRNIFKEDEFVLYEKLNSCIKNEIHPIYCIGEKKEEKNQTLEVLKKQLNNILKTNINNIIIAYEPVYAIGTGEVPKNEDIELCHTFIKSYLKEKSIDSKVLYGGSVNLSNALEILSLNNVDGLLIGGASLNPKNIVEIYDICK